MKVRIDIDGNMDEPEVVIRCGQVDESVRQLEALILKQSASSPEIVFYKDDMEFYFSLEDVLFFETEAEVVYAHTKDDSFRTKYRLYELEEILPRFFIRAAKSTIINVRQIYSIRRDITASSQVQFAGTRKQVYVSRHYYHALRERLLERNL